MEQKFNIGRHYHDRRQSAPRRSLINSRLTGQFDWAALDTVRGSDFFYRKRRLAQTFIRTSVPRRGSINGGLNEPRSLPFAVLISQ
jgi:hypothetical protein